MPSIWVAALVGMAGGVLTSAVGYLLTRGRTQSEIRLNTAKALEIEQRMSNAEAKADASLAGEAVRVLDSEAHGFDTASLQIDRRGGAQGALAAISRRLPNDTVAITLSGRDGMFTTTFTRYGYPGGSDALPGSGYDGVRVVRFCCQVRALGATCTFVVILKELDAPAGEHLGYRRHRVVSDRWAAIDEWFNLTYANRSRLRIEVRSPSTVPCTVEVRQVQLTDRYSHASPGGPSDEPGVSSA